MLCLVCMKTRFCLGGKNNSFSGGVVAENSYNTFKPKGKTCSDLINDT